MIPKYRAWDKETKTMNGTAEIYRNRNQEIELRPRDENIILMLSTGLKDKNGKEIFEGDIIRYNIDVVDIKRHPTLGFYTVLDGREGFFGDGMSIDDFEEDVKEFSKTAEIIGNIYENPEYDQNFVGFRIKGE